MSITVRSFSKINLGLAVGPVRADGFHGLATVYQTIGLHDLVTVSARRAEATRITLTAEREGAAAKGVPQTSTGNAEKNTAYLMVAGALERLGIFAEVEIHIDKRLPVQGGLGAGSANAAAALIALERKLGVSLPEAVRLELASEVGSDVPLFLIGGTVLGVGRGEVVSALPDLAETACVVAVPKVGVSTRAAFAELDRRFAAAGGEAGPSTSPLRGFAQDDNFKKVGGSAQDDNFKKVGGSAQDDNSEAALTSAPAVDKLEELSRVLASAFRGGRQTNGPTGISGTSDLGKSSWKTNGTGESSEMKNVDGNLAENPILALVRTGIENDFEEVAFSQHPFLRDIKRALMGNGLGEEPGKAVYAALSGSGSALFGLYSSLDDAAAAQQRVQRAGTTALLTETLSRQAYWERMFVH